MSYFFALPGMFGEVKRLCTFAAMKSNALPRWILYSLILTYLVILAGALVRASGSGMGCPDWPTCFGYLVPPTDAEPLTWRPQKSFTGGQMVILNDTLWVAKGNVKGSAVFDRGTWQKYPQHNYAVFNPLHTWIEYLNRLIGALLGLFSLILLPLWWVNRKALPRLGLWIVFEIVLLGFQAWLGRLVVDSNLAPVKITLHMLGALALVMVLLLMLYNIVSLRKNPIRANGKLKTLMGLLFLTTLVQIILGTQVRQQVDEILKEGPVTDGWFDQLSVLFDIHKTFALLVIALNALLLNRFKLQHPELKQWQQMVLVLLCAEMLVGTVIQMLNIPPVMQILHILIACVVFGIQTWLLFILLLPGAFISKNNSDMSASSDKDSPIYRNKRS